MMHSLKSIGTLAGAHAAHGLLPAHDCVGDAKADQFLFLTGV